MNQESHSDTDLQNKDWTFKNENIAKNFRSHVTSHLPWYDLVTDLIVCIGENYLPENGRLLDVGASRGNITAAMNDLLHRRKISPISIETSKQMCDEFEGVGDVINRDILDYEAIGFDLVICYLTLMFNNISKRALIIEKLVKSINPGGAVVVVEKFEIPESGYSATVQRRMTMRMKVNTGIDFKEIVDKELSLSSIQRPLRYSEIDSYSPVEFFRFGEFRGFIIEK